MARQTGGVGLLKIVLLMVLILVLVFGGLIWFDFLGLIDVKDTMAPITSRLGIRSRDVIEEDDDFYLLDRERLAKQREAIDLRNQQLDLRSQDLDMHLAELKQYEDQLLEKENALTEKEKSLNQAVNRYENEEENIRQSARYLMGMEPEKAVAQLVTMDEYDAVNLLRMSERIAQEENQASLVAYWLSLMEPDKSASLHKKMIRGSEEDLLTEEPW